MSAAPAIAAKPIAREPGSALPVAVICLVILIVWYVAAIPMNWVVTSPKIETAGGGLSNILSFSWNDARPVIPAPHQIAAELWKSVFTVAPWMPKSLLYHGWVTLSSTLLGFVLGKLMEEKLRQAMILSRGSFMTFVERPLSAALLVVSVVMLTIAMLPSMRQKRDKVFTE